MTELGQPKPIDSILVRKEVFKLAWPIMLQNTLMIMTLIVDTIMLGHYKTTSLAATGIGTPINLMVRLVLMCIPITATAMVSRAIGEGNKEKANINASMALMVGLALGGLVSLGGAFGARVMTGFFLDINSELGQEAITYLSITLSAFVMSYVFLIGTAILRAASDTKTALIITIFSNLLNVLGNYLLIFGKLGFPEWGIRGAAIATAAAWSVECVCMLLVLFIGKAHIKIKASHFLKITKGMFTTLMRISMPAALEPFLAHIGSLLFLKIVATFGAVSLATHHILLRIEGFSFMPAMGLSMAAGALFGQVLGAKELGKTGLIRKESLRLTIIIMGSMGILFIIFRRFIISGFTGDMDIRELGALCLIIAAVEQPIIGYAMIHQGVLRGAGDTRSTLYVNVMGVWLVRLPLAYLLAVTFNMGLLGVWLVMPVDWLFRSFIFSLVYKGGRWKRINI
ncbi:MAG: MATE family efflux transporter [Candidatus Brocadiia bacterium]